MTVKGVAASWIPRVSWWNAIHGAADNEVDTQSGYDVSLPESADSSRADFPTNEGVADTIWRLPLGVEEPLKGGYEDIQLETSPSGHQQQFETVLVEQHYPPRKRTLLTVTTSAGSLQDVTETDTSSSDDDNDDLSNFKASIAPSPTTTTRKHSIWSNFIKKWIHRPVLWILRGIARASARSPILTIVVITTISLLLLVIGIFTNFQLDLSPNLMWTPVGSFPILHQTYIENTFPTPQRRLSVLFHAKGDNVVLVKHVRKAFDVISIVQEHPDYDSICGADEPVTGSLLPKCIIYGIPRFWGNDVKAFEELTTNEETLQRTIASERFPDLLPVLHDDILGNYQRNETHVLSAESFTLIVSLPDTELTRPAELDLLYRILAMSDTELQITSIADDSITQELIRSIYDDIPLVPIIFIAMSLYTMAVFSRNHKVFSRSCLGFAAVVAVVLSLASGFGLLFWIGVPFTPITQLLPFLMFSLGLDDCFIIMGAYARTDSRQTAVDRIDATVVDIGLSITLTTVTTATAFGLGCFSSIPAIYWLCQYCAPTIVVVFVYQISFFVACIALDERRIRNGRLDIACCFQDKASADVEHIPHSHFADHLMEWYANQLLRPSVRIIAMIGFLVLYGFACYGASRMTQKFSIAEVLPRDSYVGDYLETSATYRDESKISIQVVFRDVDQADPFVRYAMGDYAQQLGELDFMEEPAFGSFWMTQFDRFLDQDVLAAQLPFTEALDRFLENPFHKLAVGNDIVRTPSGDIIASRIHLKMTVSDDVQEQIHVLTTQHMLTLQQSVNHGRGGRLAFFTFAKAYLGFENYSRGVRDLISTAITGVVAVTFVAIVFIPHWSAALVVCPLIIVLYIELLGVMQWGGLHLNSMTSMSMTISIGLLVDFVVHILFRYYEEPGTRQQKTVAMLRTMGSSVLLGGTTTLLGTLPLVFASSDALQIVFVSFLGIVLLGVGHGLVLLPVLLATYGPEDTEFTRKQIQLCHTPSTSQNSDV